MPTLNLTLSPPQNPARLADLAEALTAITVATLGKRAEVTAVLIDERRATHWTIGGKTPQRPTAWLEIKVTAGTNSTDQKAAFIAAAFAELQQQLAPGAQLEAASYVIVHELPATDWGYGGQTQRARQVARERVAEAHAA
jgi:4-oxalocrotonate tautomerase